MRTPPDNSNTPTRIDLFDTWQAEAIRLRETHWGPLEDRAACLAARRDADSLAGRIVRRAQWLAQHQGLDVHLRRWAGSARWILAMLWAGALLAGVGAASAALGQPGASVNLALALLALLGLHVLTLLIWLISLLPGATPTGALSQLWLWITRKLVRGPDALLAGQAFLSLLSRLGAWKSAVGLISHAAWVAAYVGAIPTLVVLLSTRRYTFHWETTLLSPDAFVTLTRALGSLPAWLGFRMPDTDQIAATLGATPLPAAAQADWSLWFIGCVLTWGLVPRAIALVACVLHLRRRLRAPGIDPGLPGWLELRDRLLPMHQSLGIDRPAWAPSAAGQAASGTLASVGPSAIIGFELGVDLDWPPADLPATVHDLGRCDSRADRSRIRQTLWMPPKHLLLICDARLTPDRGTRAWLGELNDLCPDFQVLRWKAAPGTMDTHWQRLLDDLGIGGPGSLHQWLAHIQGMSSSI